MLAAQRISIGCIELLFLHAIARGDEIRRMSDAQVQGVGESSHSHSAEVHDTVERHQEKGKYREGSMRTILDNLRQQNETTSLLLRSLHEHFQNQNKLLETLTAKPIPNSTSVPEPQAAGSGAESTQ